jgi:hypothetical protein
MGSCLVGRLSLGRCSLCRRGSRPWGVALQCMRGCGCRARRRGGRLQVVRRGVSVLEDVTFVISCLATPLSRSRSQSHPKKRKRRGKRMNGSKEKAYPVARCSRIQRFLPSFPPCLSRGVSDASLEVDKQHAHVGPQERPLLSVKDLNAIH